MINELMYEVWYKSPTGRTRRMAAFHMRFMAEKFIECLSEKERESMYIVKIEK